jgi:signal transduction histidine kinase
LAADIDAIPLLGQILTDMGVVTKEQLEETLKEQDKMLEIYKSIESEKLGAAIEIGSIVNSTLNLADVLTLIMKHVNRVTDSVASTLMLLDDNTDELVFSVPTGPRADKLTDIRIPSGEGIAGWVAKHGEPVLVPDIKEDPRFYSKVDKMSGFETKSILCVPLKAKTKLIGVLEVMNKIDGTSFAEEDALVLTIFAYQAAMAIENARLYGELKDQLEERKRSEQEKLQLGKLGALGTLIAGTAHELNNPMMGMLNFIQYCLKYTSKDDRRYTVLEDAERETKRCIDIVQNLLTFSRIEKEDEEEHIKQSIPAIFDRVFRLLSYRIDKENILLTQDYPEETPEIWLKNSNIQQVFLNLIGNALDAVKGNKEKKKKIRVEIRPESEFVLVTITDSGCGISSKNLRNIFDPFFTTKPTGRGTGYGTGLGLSVCHSIVKAHGGEISCESEDGKGTKFKIRLPIDGRKPKKQ